MEINVLDQNGKKTGTITVSEKIFARDFNQDLIHQLIVAYQSNSRLATRKQKNREEVSHTTHKPYRQKGTGRARAGMSASPLWRGGGRAFPNTPEENFEKKINKKMYRIGICSILSKLVKDGRLSVVDQFSVDAPKTKLMASKTKAFGFSSMLLVVDQINENIFLSSRNLRNLLIIEPKKINPVSLVKYDHVLLTRQALVKVEELFREY